MNVVVVRPQIHALSQPHDRCYGLGDIGELSRPAMTMFGRPLKTNTTALPDLDLKYDSERHMRRQTTAFEGAVKRSIKMAVIPQVSDAMAGAGATFTTQEAAVHGLCCMRSLAPSHRCIRGGG